MIQHDLPQEISQLYRILAETMNEGAATLLEDATIFYCNSRLAEMLKTPIEKMIDSSLARFVAPGDLPNFRALLQEGGVAGGRSKGEITFRCEDGTLVPAQLSLSSLPMDGTKSACLVVTDLTRRQQAERAYNELEIRLRERTGQLQVANKELETFSHSVSIDLSAPLRSINGFCQALLEDYGDRLDPPGLDYLHRVRAASKRMAQIINELLNLTRLTRMEMRQEEVDLSAVAKSIAAELQSAAKSAREVEFVIAEGITAHSDPQLLHVILENLLGNAWKFTAKHSRARIEFGVISPEKSRHDKPIYFVHDDGAGFDMAYVNKLFGAFQRLHATTEFEGNGIGLATVKRIIQRHGGRVWAEGEVERGATFYFTL